MKYILALFLATLHPTLSLASSSKDIQWSLVQATDRLKIYKGTVPQSPLIAFRGIRTMPVPIAKVAQVLFTKDIGLRKKWVDSLVDSANLEQSTPNTAVIYNAFKAPWPIAKRDFVSLVEIRLDPAQKMIHLQMKPTQHPKAPPSVGVRAEILHSLYTLKALSAKETEVSIEAMVDFKGSLPIWLVNFIQSRWPEKTLANMQAAAEDPQVLPLDWVDPALLSH